MSKSDRRWEWILRALIYLCPMGALAYYAVVREEEPDDESPRDEHPAPVFFAPQSQFVIRLARG